MSAKRFRLARFSYPMSPMGLIVPIDHGLTLGPMAGIDSVRSLSRWISHPAICGVIAHKGIAERLMEAGVLDGKGLMIHLNGMTTLSRDPDTKERLTTIEAAIRLGADAVSFQLNFSGQNDAANLRLMGQVVDEASEFHVPVLAMIYDKAKSEPREAVSRQRHLIRVATELGCDAVKIAAADPQSLPEILAGISDDIAVYLAGGSLAREEEFYELAHTAVRAGIRGLCVGRNVFGRSNVHEVLTQLRLLLAPKASLAVTEPRLERGIAYGPH